MLAPLRCTPRQNTGIGRESVLYKEQWVTTTITDMMCISRALTLVHP